MTLTSGTRIGPYTGHQCSKTSPSIRSTELAAIADREIERAGVAGVEVGVAFVHDNGTLGWYDDECYRLHRATLGGALTRIVE